MPVTRAGVGATVEVGEISSLAAGALIVGDGDGAPAAQTVSGDVTMNSSGVVSIGSGVISNTHINSAAAIAHSKLAAITAGRVLLGDASNVPTATALSGVITVDSSGVTAFVTDMATQAELNTHEADTTSVHGIADTAQVALKDSANTFTLAQTISVGGLDALSLSSTDPNTGITVGGDTRWYRSAANTWKTDDRTIFDAGIQMSGTPSVSDDVNVLFGTGTATTLGLIAGSTPALLSSSGSFVGLRGNTYSAVATQRGNVFIGAGNPSTPTSAEGVIGFYTGATALRVLIPNDRDGFEFGSARDTNLYRGGASTLKTDDQFDSAVEIQARAGAAGVATVIGARGPAAQGGMSIGSDINLYREAADILATDDKLHVVLELEVDGALNHDGSTVGFYGVTPVARPDAYTQTYSTATRTHANPTATALTSNGVSANNVLVDVATTGIADPSKINANFDDVADEINKLIDDVANIKQVVNSVIDDDQSQGLKQ